MQEFSASIPSQSPGGVSVPIKGSIKCRACGLPSRTDQSNHCENKLQGRLGGRGESGPGWLVVISHQDTSNRGCRPAAVIETYTELPEKYMRRFFVQRAYITDQGRVAMMLDSG